jgi:L-cysteine desulfidase
VSVFADESSASVRISHYHTNIMLITKNDEIIYQNQGCDEVDISNQTDRSILKIRDILEFAETVDVQEVEELLQRQIDYNMAIAEEGLKSDWGANVGSVLIDSWGNDVKVRAKALAAAGSDARMSGCELPVMIVSGSGNQGITASVPVIVYAKELGSDKGTLLRALIVSNLVTIHQKTGIGQLSAFCGVVSAGCGAGAGIAWLHGGRFEEVAHTIVNALATVSGIVCDGAKPSCAAKISASVDAGILGFLMFERGQQFYGGDGLVSKGVENTINNISRLGRDGMRETDKEIIRIMLGE